MSALVYLSDWKDKDTKISIAKQVNKCMPAILNRCTTKDVATEGDKHLINLFNSLSDNLKSKRYNNIAGFVELDKILKKISFLSSYILQQFLITEKSGWFFNRKKTLVLTNKAVLCAMRSLNKK